jgi:hypothetical protein
VFVLDTKDEVFQFIGKSASAFERAKGILFFLFILSYREVASSARPFATSEGRYQRLQSLKKGRTTTTPSGSIWEEKGQSLQPKRSIFFFSFFPSFFLSLCEFMA